MLSSIFDVLFPRKSIWEDSGFWVSDDDWKTVPFLPYFEHQDELTSRGLGSLNGLLSATRYRQADVIQKAIRIFKYKRVPGLTQKLSEFIIRASLPYVHYDITLVPVPLHYSRKISRGFNQAELLARRVSQATDLPMQQLLRRTKDTGHQAWRSRYERMESMRSVFRLNFFSTEIPKHIVLIDDIATTGATLDACADVLKTAGATTVDAWVIARV